MIFTKTLQKLLEQGLTLQVCELDRPLPQRKNKKVVRLKKDELGE